MAPPPKSFESLAARYRGLAREWHPKKNGTLTPRDAARGSRMNVWWICGEGHEWQEPVKNRTARDLGCPVCFP